MEETGHSQKTLWRELLAPNAKIAGNPHGGNGRNSEGRLANRRREFELAFSLHDNSMTAVFFGS
jgi:hypothetical protein